MSKVAACVEHFDVNGKKLISAGMPTNGHAAVHHYDQNGKPRIVAGTLAKGQARILVADAAGKSVGTLP